MSKKSILFILPDLNPGGAERIVTTILNHIDLDKYSPKLMLMRKEGVYLEILKSEIEIVDLKIQRIRQSIFPILKYIYKHKPDIVFTGYGEVNAFLSPFVPLFRNTKFIARETNVVSQHITKKTIQFFYKFYPNFKTIICQSDDMMHDLIQNFGIKKQTITKINNPVDVEFIQNKTQESFDEPLYKNVNKKVIAIGNLSSRKGIDNLLKVFSYLKDEPIDLFILGDGAQKEEYINLKEELKLEKVHFLGIKKNPYNYLQNSDLFILSSRYEGFPNVLLEAGVCGTYALANNCPGGINEIIQDGINGEIADIENHQEFSKKIKEVLAKKHDKEKIEQSIVSRFSKEIILKKYFNLFDSVNS
ncbi:MAG: glycosyltransferase [Flavobacteriales bacterium]|nr:glycosyltransferase [Flavobacteriales bacterium]